MNIDVAKEYDLLLQLFKDYKPDTVRHRKPRPALPRKGTKGHLYSWTVLIVMVCFVAVVRSTRRENAF